MLKGCFFLRFFFFTRRLQVPNYRVKRELPVPCPIPSPSKGKGKEKEKEKEREGGAQGEGG